MRNSSEDLGMSLGVLNFIYREELTPRRGKMVQKVFQMLDRDGSGQVTVRDVIGIFDVSLNPDYI